MHRTGTPMNTPSASPARRTVAHARQAGSTPRSRRRLRTLVLSSVIATAAFAGAPETAWAHATAADVVSRSTLRAFVERARAHAQAAVSNATEQEAFDFFDREFRPAGQWRHGSIYLVVLNAEGADRGTILFHAARPDLEGSNLWNSEDKNGVRIAQELIANAGRNFVEYYFDNPAVVGDEEEGSLKVAYPENLRIGGHRYVINCGFYPATVPVAPPFALLLLALVLGAGGAYRLAQGASAPAMGALQRGADRMR